MRVLVTGGTGVVGPAAVTLLLKHGVGTAGASGGSTASEATVWKDPS